MRRPSAKTAFLSLPVAIFIAGWVGVPDTVLAVNLTAPTQVIARVGASCSSAMAADLDFGTITNTSVNTDVTGTVTITCTNATVFTLTASSGVNASGAQRRMKSASNAYMNYDIYTTSARTTSYPTSGTTQSYTATGGPLDVSIFGRAPAQTVLGSGAFSDVVTWTMSY